MAASLARRCRVRLTAPCYILPDHIIFDTFGNFFLVVTGSGLGMPVDGVKPNDELSASGGILVQTGPQRVSMNIKEKLRRGCIILKRNALETSPILPPCI